jgi:hypothetical protein
MGEDLRPRGVGDGLDVLVILTGELVQKMLSQDDNVARAEAQRWLAASSGSKIISR